MRATIHALLAALLFGPSILPAEPAAGAGGTGAPSPEGSENASPAVMASRFPDLTQTDPKGGFARDGKSFCGPVAVSNSLVGLFGDRLHRSRMSQYDLVNRLAAPDYMATHEVEGTGINGLLRGVRRCLDDWGINDYALEYQGWRPHRAEFATGVAEPAPEWIAGILEDGGAVWLNVGWYRTAGAGNGGYERIGGHWVTAIRLRMPPDPNTPPIVAVHDPAPRAGTVPSREEVELIPLEPGTLTGPARNLPRPATGLLRMAGGMHVKKGADLAILDGAAALRWLHPRTAGSDNDSAPPPDHPNSP